MRILVVEDDHIQADWIKKKLQDAFAQTHGGVELIVINTESEFRTRLPELANSLPDVIVMDVMLRWADPSPDLARPPQDVIQEGFYRAGLRCERLLASDPRTSSIPVVLYTVLDSNAMDHEITNLRPNVKYLPKSSDVEPLAKMIRELTTAE